MNKLGAMNLFMDLMLFEGTLERKGVLKKALGITTEL
jgi:hypothetical protein